jgi:hypothetical protein
MKVMTDDLEHIAEAPIDQSIAVRAGPGAGKTYLIAQRVAHLIKNGLRRNSQIACITYTNTGIEEIEGELLPRHFLSKPWELFLGTIHSFLIDYVLGPYGHFLSEIPDNFKLTPPDGYAGRFCPSWIKRDMPAYRLQLFESIGYQLDGTPICYRETRRWKPSIRQMRIFKDHMHQAGYIDLHDVLFFSWRILTEFPFIADCLAARFVSILVDEFQDTTVVQNAILQIFQTSGRTSLFLVGDPDQSIFSFAGAVPETFREHLRSSRFHCEICGQTEHQITVNRRSSQKVLDFLNCLSTMPDGQTALAPWQEWPQPVRVFTAGQQQSGNAGPSQFQRDTLQYFFRIVEDNGIDIDEEEAFCVLAYENKSIATLQTLYSQESPGPDSLLDDLKEVNRRLYRIVYDLLVAIKHKKEGEWALAYEATERALTRLVFDNSNPRFCSFDDEAIGLNRQVWPVVVWIVMDQMHTGESQTLLAWCRTVKELIDQAVQLAGGNSIRRSKLGVLNCGGRARQIAHTCQVANELHAVIRPNLIGDNYRTIHKAKGIQREAVLVFAKDSNEFGSWLFSPDISEDESGRRGFVAFSRARRVLCICCESLLTEQKRQLQERNLEVVTLGQHQLALF